MGKHSHNFIDLTGQVFGRLTVIRFVGKGRSRKVLWLCKCKCGKETVVNANNLKRNTKSCGCLKREISVDVGKISNFKHGEAKSPEYQSWIDMIRRCRDEDNISWKFYGGRGIKVCERWHNFLNFLRDMGRKPFLDAQIDRNDNQGNYCPENCRWATRQEQARNKSNNVFLTYQGETKCLAEWANILGVRYQTLHDRLRKLKWSIGRVLSTPVKEYKNSHNKRD